MKSPAQSYLEGLQEQYFLSVGENPHQWDLDFEKIIPMTEKLSQSIPSMTQDKMREIYSSFEKPESPFESPQMYWLVQNLCKEIEEAARVLEKPVVFKPVIGTLPSGQVNARAICLPESNDYIIILEREVFLFSSKLSKIIATVMPFAGTEGDFLKFELRTAKDKTAYIRSIQANEQFMSSFLEVVLSYVVGGRPSLAKHYIPDGNTLTLSGIIRQGMELFVVGHEYGHIIKGHFAEGSPTKSNVGNQPVIELLLSWQQEFEADAQGMELMLAAMRINYKMPVALSFWGSDFFFTCIDVVERSVAILADGSEELQPNKSHPPPSVRREFLREVLARSLDDPKETEGAIEIGRHLEWASEAFWGYSRLILRRLYEKGQRPHPSWAASPG